MTVHQLKPRNPRVMLKSRSKRPKPYGGERQHLTETELSKFLKALEGSPRDYLMGLITYLHGLRVSELIGLKWADLDEKAGTLFIARVKQGLNLTHVLERDELAKLKALRKAQDPASIFIFPNGRTKGSGQLSRSGVFRIFGEAGRKVGIPDMHPHRLRHSTATHQANSGMDPFKLQRFMGHAAMSSTLDYVKLSTEPIKDAWKGKR